MIKHIALWYLRKINAQVIMNIHFLEHTKVTGVKNKDFHTIDNNGEELSIYPNYKEEVENK